MESISSIIDRLTTYIIDPIILLIFSAGFVVFMYGLVEMIWSLNTGKVEQKGKDHMLWGILGMTIMVSVWGILGLLNNTFGLNWTFKESGSTNVTIPGGFE